MEPAPWLKETLHALLSEMRKTRELNQRLLDVLLDIHADIGTQALDRRSLVDRVTALEALTGGT